MERHFSPCPPENSDLAFIDKLKGKSREENEVLAKKLV